MISRSYISTKALVLATTLNVCLTGFGVPFAAGSESSGVDQKVVVELYYESQCPGCREMITTSFKDAFQKDGFLDMADVVFVPYGNAQEKDTESGGYEFECQHGPSECVYNTIEVCALAKIECPKMAFQYIDCIERSDESRDPEQDYYKVAMTCCKLVNIPEDTVSQMEECAVGAEGIQLEHEAALKTKALDPPHEYVPYVVVNGEHEDNVENAISKSLWDYICRSYLGPNKSPACKGVTTGLRASASGVAEFPLAEKNVCYRGDGPLATSTEADAPIVAEE
jgi:interferon gamma-inducible protein 30